MFQTISKLSVVWLAMGLHQAAAIGQLAGSSGLVEQLRSPSPQVRLLAAQGLERSPPNDLHAALPYLEDAARDTDALVRRSAMTVLWRAAISSVGAGALVRGVMPTITERASDQDAEVRTTAARILGLLGKSSPYAAMQALIPLAQDANEAVRVAALHGLGAASESTRLAVPTLLQRMRSDGAPDVRGAAAFALRYASQDAETITALVAALDDPSAHVKSQAIASLGYIGPAAAKAVPKLAALAMLPGIDPQLREDVSYALKSIQRSR